MMKPKVIKTETEYEMAVAHLETLMDAEPSSSQGDELELFAVLIENYEREHFPLGLPDPVEAIKFRMEQQGLSRKDLEKYIGSASKVSEVLNHKRPLSLAMMRALHDGLGISAEVLLQEDGGELDAPIYDLNKYPFTEMFKEGYFSFFNGTLQAAKEVKEELLNRLFSAFQGLSFERAYCRSSAHEKMDVFALDAWQARVFIIADEQDLPPYIPNSLTEEDVRYMISLSAFDRGPLLALEFLERHGIPLVILKHLSHTFLDGACFKSPSGRPVIGMTLRHDRLDNFWFTLAHELGHLFLHLDQDNFAFFDETETDHDRNEFHDPKEKEANDFASNVLIVKDEWQHWRKTTGKGNIVSKEEIYLFAQRLGISPAIVAGRLRWETGDYVKYSLMLGNKAVKRLFEPN
ncbi:MAG: ImmA/IrrE family metallo-endopeptidase [Anaerolineales bacterium]